MRQTTVRFGEDLWAELEREAANVGVSVAQFLREAAVARLAYARGRCGDPDFDSALRAAGVGPADAIGGSAPSEPVQRARRAASLAADSGRSSEAVWAEARQARARATELRKRVARVTP